MKDEKLVPMPKVIQDYLNGLNEKFDAELGMKVVNFIGRKCKEHQRDLMSIAELIGVQLNWGVDPNEIVEDLGNV